MQGCSQNRPEVGIDDLGNNLPLPLSNLISRRNYPPRGELD